MKLYFVMLDSHARIRAETAEEAQKAFFATLSYEDVLAHEDYD
jgi:hypothetical protein